MFLLSFLDPVSSTINPEPSTLNPDVHPRSLRETICIRPGVEPRANLESIAHRCHLFEVIFVREMTKETIHLPLSCLEGPEADGLVGVYG